MGLGTYGFFNSFRTLLSKRDPVLFFCVTLCKKEKVEQVKAVLGFEGSFIVEARGHSGGLAMLWKKQEAGKLLRKLLSFSTNHIDMELNIEGHPVFRMTGFYGEPQRSLRRSSWNLIRQLSEASSLPWCLVGDLNNILRQSDKRGGRPYPNWLISGFQEVCYDCNLVDMDLVGYPYTWEKGKGTYNWIEIRLDRALVTQDWNSLFPIARLENNEISASDHCPIWLNLGVHKLVKVARRFRFENAWVREPMCKQIVQDNWEMHSTDPLQRKIKCCSTALAEWGRDITGNFKGRIADCNKILRRLKSRRDTGSVATYKETQSKLFEILAQKEIFWKQRSKELWLQAGDQNTKFFHACASNKKKTEPDIEVEKWGWRLGGFGVRSKRGDGDLLQRIIHSFGYKLIQCYRLYHSGDYGYPEFNAFSTSGS